MLAVIEEYQEIKKNIAYLIEVSGYRQDFVAKKIGIHPSYFATKKQRGNWSDSDIANIISVLTGSNHEVENYLDARKIEKNNDGSYITSEEFKKRAGWK